MSKTIWQKKLGGSLKIYQRERSKFIWVSFYVSPSFSSNGLYRKSLKPITSKTDGANEAKRLFRTFDFDKFNSKRLETTLNETALKAINQRIAHYKLKNRMKEIERGMKVKNTGDSEMTRYVKELKPYLGNIPINDRDQIQKTVDELVDKWTSIGNEDGTILTGNTITKYLNLIQVICKQGVGDGMLNLTIKNPPVDRRSNARPSYRMTDLQKITNRTLKIYELNNDPMYLELYVYLQFIISSTTRYGSETISLKAHQMKLLHTKEDIAFIKVMVGTTKTKKEFTYQTDPYFMKKYGEYVNERFKQYAPNDYFFFNSDKRSRNQINNWVQDAFVRIAKEVDVYYFNGKGRPMTSIRHIQMKRDMNDGNSIDKVAKKFNTSPTMIATHYDHDTDDDNVIKDYEKYYAKRINKVKSSRN